MITRQYAIDTGKYREEAEKSRKIAEDTLVELKTQHLAEVEEHATDRQLTMRYVEEAQKSRETADATLAELQQQHLEQYNAFVVADVWSGPHNVRLVNLGPAPAHKIIARATHMGDRQRQYLQTGITGLPVGQGQAPHLTDITPFTDIPESAMNDKDITVIVYAQTVLGKDMEPRIYLLPRSF